MKKIKQLLTTQSFPSRSKKEIENLTEEEAYGDFVIIPIDVIKTHLFSFCPVSLLGRICQLNKCWKRISEEDFVWKSICINRGINAPNNLSLTFKEFYKRFHIFKWDLQHFDKSASVTNNGKTLLKGNSWSCCQAGPTVPLTGKWIYEFKCHGSSLLFGVVPNNFEFNTYSYPGEGNPGITYGFGFKVKTIGIYGSFKVGQHVQVEIDSDKKTVKFNWTKSLNIHRGIDTRTLEIEEDMKLPLRVVCSTLGPSCDIVLPFSSKEKYESQIL